ncbi:hypothetical protein ABZ864_47655 [Streptomyces sp. NPDC047082]|uniref:hypothetical protein n=1 Tax=Streptomyces sp. NPDC047082 TaxID=3155259 RepID=UPI00340ABC43
MTFTPDHDEVTPRTDRARAARAHHRALYTAYPDETTRQVARLYHVAYTARHLSTIVYNERTTADRMAHTATRIRRARAAADRLLTLAGVADSEETPYALSILRHAERQLTGPHAQALTIAHTAHQAAQDHAHEDPQRAGTLLELEAEARCLIANAWRGWDRYAWADLRSLQQRATQLAITPAGLRP